MSSLREIKRRLKSVENIKQIAKAMEMVAASRLRRAQAKAQQSKPYTIKIKEIINNLLTEEYKHALFEKREVKKIALVVVSGDRGLCGSYNANIISAATQFLQKHPNAELICIGRKAAEHFQNKKWKIRHQMTKWSGKITFQEIKKFAKDLIEWFLSKEYDEIWLVYAHYVTVMVREIKIEKFLNIENMSNHEKKRTESFLYEPNTAEIFKQLIPRFCITKIKNVFDEAYASELAARVVSMRSATKNAKEMIEKLTLTRNKVRQESITKEMLEITSGAEGLK